MNQQDIHRALLGWLPLDIQDQLAVMRRYSLFDSRGIGTPLIACVDGTVFHGGLTDRWKGIVSLYALARALGRDFRIHYTYPFPLTTYQLPAAYDWRLRSNEMSHNMLNVCLKRVVADPSLHRMEHLPANKQIHSYANRDWIASINQAYGTHFQWGELFRELFRPSDRLQAALERFEPQTRTPYIAVAFRMQNLLGDYAEYQYAPAAPDRQQQILQACLDYLQQLHNASHQPVLVTSDSLRMTQMVNELPYVFTNSGQAAHVDTVTDAPEEQYLKSFVDFYLLAQATAVYCAGTEEMYPSDFPKYAAKLFDIPFQRVTLA